MAGYGTHVGRGTLVRVEAGTGYLEPDGARHGAADGITIARVAAKDR